MLAEVQNRHKTYMYMSGFSKYGKIFYWLEKNRESAKTPLSAMSVISQAGTGLAVLVFFIFSSNWDEKF